MSVDRKLIYADEAIEQLKEYTQMLDLEQFEDSIEYSARKLDMELINRCKGIEAEPTRNANWIMSHETCGAFETTRTYYYGRCSKCNRRVEVDCREWGYDADYMNEVEDRAYRDFPYCHCGCRMVPNAPGTEEKNEID